MLNGETIDEASLLKVALFEAHFACDSSFQIVQPELFRDDQVKIHQS
jgi:hypothetical protein